MNDLRQTDSADWQAIYLSLRQRLLDLQFLPGQIIRPAAVVSHFEMALPDVRRALATLQSEGYITGSSAGTFEVRRWTTDELRDAFELRASLIELGITATAGRKDHDLLRQLHALATLEIEPTRMTEQEAELATRCLWKFEDELLKGLGLPSLARVLPNTMSHSLHRATVRLMSIQELIDAFARLSAVAQAMSEGDIKQAKGLARQHVLLAADIFIGRYGSLTPLPRDPEIDLENMVTFNAPVDPDRRTRPYFGLGRPEEQPTG